MIQWVSAGSDEEKESGVRLLCRNGNDLGIPYKWSTVMASLACSLYQEGFMIGADGNGQVRGALAYTYGTGEDDYKDRSRIEVHLLYIEEGARTGFGLAEAIYALALQVLGPPLSIKEIGFYAEPTSGYRRLFGKFATLQSTRMHPCGMLDFYTVSPARLRQYAVRRSLHRELASN